MFHATIPKLFISTFANMLWTNCSEQLPQVSSMRIPGADQAVNNLVKWSAKDEWAPYQTEVFHEHFELIKNKLKISEQRIVDQLGEAFHMVYGFVLEDFFTARFGEEGERNVIDDYLKRRGWREKVPAKRYLEALRDSVASLYEVVALKPGHSMTLRDLILGGDPVTVEEKLGSQTAALWDRIAGRIVTVNGKTYFTGGLLLLPHDAADQVLSSIVKMAKRLRQDMLGDAKQQGKPREINESAVRKVLLSDSIACRMFTQAWLIDALVGSQRRPPEVRNTDGDPIVFSEVRFPIVGEGTKIAALIDGIEMFERHAPGEFHWTWHGRGSPHQRMSASRQEGVTLGVSDADGRTSLASIDINGNAVILSTNSRERAEKGRDLLASQFGALVGTPLMSFQDIETALEEHPATAHGDPGLPPEVAEQAIHAYLDTHYRSTLNSPLPVLGGETPNQAVQTQEGRAQVVSWLKKLENSEIRRAARDGQKPYDLSWMWKALQLEGAR